jgi:hypothetical protein
VGHANLFHERTSNSNWNKQYCHMERRAEFSFACAFSVPGLIGSYDTLSITVELTHFEIAEACTAADY